jgi:RNA exonuclease 1
MQCYTTGGFELIRISAVDKAGKTIMDELVKPKHTVLDLNSRFRYAFMLDGSPIFRFFYLILLPHN